MDFLFSSSCLQGWYREPAGGRQSSGSTSVPKLYPSGHGSASPNTTERREPDPSSPQKDSASSGLPSLHPKHHPLPFKHISKWMLPFPTSVTSPQSWLSDKFIRQVALGVKNPPASAGEVRDVGSIPGSGRSPGEGSGNPLQCSCLENPMDWGVWLATVPRVTKRQTTERLSLSLFYLLTISVILDIVLSTPKNQCERQHIKSVKNINFQLCYSPTKWKK